TRARRSLVALDLVHSLGRGHACVDPVLTHPRDLVEQDRGETVGHTAWDARDAPERREAIDGSVIVEEGQDRGHITIDLEVVRLHQVALTRLELDQVRVVSEGTVDAPGCLPRRSTLTPRQLLGLKLRPFDRRRSTGAEILEDLIESVVIGRRRSASSRGRLLLCGGHTVAPSFVVESVVSTSSSAAACSSIRSADAVMPLSMSTASARRGLCSHMRTARR